MMMLMIAWSRWLSRAIFYGVIVINLGLDAWLLRILRKQAVRKQLPWFVSFIVWDLVATAISLGTWIVGRSLYVPVSWWTEVLSVVLLVAAVRESLLRIFEGFESVLRWYVLAAIVAVILYSAWKAVKAPPVDSNWLASFTLGAEFTFRWGVAAVTIVAIGLGWLIGEPSGTREGAVITGSAMASMGFVAWSIVLSFFGPRVIFFAQYLPNVGYFIAAYYWIRIFQRPIQEFGFKELGMGPHEIRKQMSLYREILELIAQAMRKKLW